MGLLTDPNAGQGKLIKLLIKYHLKLCVLMYIGAVVWFFLLAHKSVNLATYFSENALLPGLVKSEFNEETTAKLYYSELLNEMRTYTDGIPSPWLLAKFRQMGLDTYTHNFTLNYPLGRPQKFKGKNIYAILRAPRAASTEAIVLSVPYRTPSSVHPTTAPSVAIMLAFAKFANRERYWAKDIIFLVTEHEQLGIQAWLEAYHSSSCGTVGILEHGDLRGRAGAIQAAINLEIHNIAIDNIDVKIEGLNGHLPNLDLVTLVNRMCTKEDIQSTFKNRRTFRSSNAYEDWKYSFETMILMIATQSTGVPNGNHGLFHRFGIDAVTIEGSNIKQTKHDSLLILGHILEGLFRSLNNLLERFHQSYFFYILLSSDRFVSIGLYIPVIMTLAGTLFVKSCAHWYLLNGESEKNKKAVKKTEDQIDLVRVGYIILLTHAIGICVMNLPRFISLVGLLLGYPTDISVYSGFGMISVFLLFLPFVIPGANTEKNMHVLNIFCNLEMGTALIAIGMMNFSLALYCGILYIPVALIISPTRTSFRSKMMKVFWSIVHPFIVMSTVVFIYTYFTFPNEELQVIFIGSIRATRQALMFSIVDSLIYGNWLYKVATAIFLPNWLCYWFVMFPDYKKEDKNVLKKKSD